MEYDRKDFTGFKFNQVTEPVPDNITGTCFYQENLDKNKAVVEFDIFPPGTVCTFIRCNMTNVKKQAGFTYIDCQDETLCVQMDGEDWHTDDIGNAISPKNVKGFDRAGVSKDPKDIVSIEEGTRVTKEVTKQLEGL